MGCNVMESSRRTTPKGIHVGALNAPKIWVQTLGIFKISKTTNTLASPSKKTCNILLHPCIASVELPCLDTTHLQKCMYMQEVYAGFIKALTVWS